MAKPTRITVKIRETGGDQEETRMSFYLGSSINTLAGIETAAQLVIEGLQACITGQVYEAAMSLSFDTSGWTLTPTGGTATDRLVGARLVLASDEPFYAQINLPTFDLAKLTAAGEKTVNQSDTDIAAFLAAVTTGTVITTNEDNEVSDIVSFLRTFGGRK